MSTRTAAIRTSNAGYAVGMGLAFVPLLGIPVRYMFQGLTPFLVYFGAFLLGALVGVIFAAYKSAAYKGERPGS